MNGREFAGVIADTLVKLGAVNVAVGAHGLRSHWGTEFEARVALDQFQQMGFTQVELFRDNGRFAVYVKFDHSQTDKMTTGDKNSGLTQ